MTGPFSAERNRAPPGHVEKEKEKRKKTVFIFI
jgi:hypothetical protein